MESKIYQAIADIMAEVEAIGKNQKNQQQGFKFRGIDDVYNAIHPLFAKHGVFTVPTVVNERTEDRVTKSGGNLIYRVLTIQYSFFAVDGSHVDATVIGEGMDSGDKAANKAMAVGHKYALLQVLCIPTEDMVDPDSETQEPSRKPDKFDKMHIEHLAEYENRINNSDWDEAKKQSAINWLDKCSAKDLERLDDSLYKGGF